jgi:hypothetical protein
MRLGSSPMSVHGEACSAPSTGDSARKKGDLPRIVAAECSSIKTARTVLPPFTLSQRNSLGQCGGELNVIVLIYTSFLEEPNNGIVPAISYHCICVLWHANKRAGLLGDCVVPPDLRALEKPVLRSAVVLLLLRNLASVRRGRPPRGELGGSGRGDIKTC